MPHSFFFFAKLCGRVGNVMLLLDGRTVERVDGRKDGQQTCVTVGRTDRRA